MCTGVEYGVHGGSVGGGGEALVGEPCVVQSPPAACTLVPTDGGVRSAAQGGHRPRDDGSLRNSLPITPGGGCYNFAVVFVVFEPYSSN